jgi:L-amino acid N-acyltransferase YncA
MKAGQVMLRDASPADMPAIAGIYAHHVIHGCASFELDAPGVEEIARRHTVVTSLGLPWIVAEEHGIVIGYAYAARYRERPAYRHTVEDSIYLDHRATGRGIGTLLLTKLIDQTSRSGARQMIAVIGDSANAGSIRLHERCGFTHTGTLKAVGWKFGRWVDSVLMQRVLGEGHHAPP